MAKRNQVGLPSWALALLAALLLTGAWLMKLFPVFLFAGFAPLFALIQRSNKKDFNLQSVEWIFLVLLISYATAHLFEMSLLVRAAWQGILLTTPFIAYRFSRHYLGERLGLLPLIFFWLAVEYLILKFDASGRSVFLADALALKQEWYHWTIHTGYLGVSAWLLICNVILYYAVFQQKLNVYLLVLFALAITVPLVISYVQAEEGVTRQAMLSLYHHMQSKMYPHLYQERGEVAARTSAWVSVLILLFALVKFKTKRK